MVGVVPGKLLKISTLSAIITVYFATSDTPDLLRSQAAVTQHKRKELFMEHLEYFIAIVEEKNLTKAAQRLFITQPSLTRYVNKLEEEYGVKLLDRAKLPISLTPEGSLFLQEKLKIETTELNLRKRLKQMAQSREKITIGTGYSRAGFWLPQAVETFARRYPDMDLGITTCGELKLPGKLLSGEIDVAVGAFSLEDPAYEQLPLGVESMRLLVPKAFGLTPEDLTWEQSFDNPYVLRPEQLSGLDCVESDDSIGSYMGRLSLEQQYNIVHGRTITAGSADVIRMLVRDGMGYGYVSVRKESKNIRAADGDVPVVACTLPGLPLTRYSYAAYSKSSRNLQRIRELVAMIQKDMFAYDARIKMVSG